MVTIMDMTTGKAIEEPTEEYGDEVLNANWLPPQPEVAARLQEVEHAAHEAPVPPIDVEHFLEAVYRYQE
ncbi:hypothetical protein [Aromatoleum petrolei]|uniref:Uncharacterized protein n=1 Tax=Aromatoleum petrolei TaxID=76116 RepID=A0ABX1MPU6_9RHOO|nr:hypothetical protein [Aromatoleum petrolei]NMF89977.1 hypothetical protein [Aromatoleum petrolei]QTQ36390.1 Uncharacterized protein ToN1_22470 [Aromatoleum petrolei]